MFKVIGWVFAIDRLLAAILAIARDEEGSQRVITAVANMGLAFWIIKALAMI